jgi:hypothetical protein
MGVPAALLGNLLIIGTLLYFWFLYENDRDLFYQSVQEDEYLEWGTFWGFALAWVVCWVAAWRQRREARTWPWFLVGVGLFCFVVAMEEISWGQRVFGYRPPVYFLEHNFQQELNVHNVMDDDLRQLAVQVVIVGYGVVLPLLGLLPIVGRLLLRLGVVVPPPELIPSFAASYWVYEEYPFEFSGEITEYMLGLGFLFAALVRWWEIRQPGPGTPLRWRHAASVGVAWTAVLLLGIGNAAASEWRLARTPELVIATSREVTAMSQDFQDRTRVRGRLATRCGVHKRVYTWVQKYDGEFLLEGRYAGLVAQGLPRERAEFFLDPWNNPYWIRDYCDTDSGARVVFLYSFGPNRRRDSNRTEIREDDVGAMIHSVGRRVDLPD